MLPNIIFIFALAGIILIILRRLPEAVQIQDHEGQQEPVDKRLMGKGLPAQAFSKAKVWSRLWSTKIWNFILEAKDLKPNPVTGYRIKKIFGHIHKASPDVQKPADIAPATAVAAAVPAQPKDENFYLELIKKEPKNLANYDALGKFYVEKENFADAKDIYLYLTSHEPTKADHHGRLAFCYYKMGMFDKAAEHYKTSIDMDSTQPNRYYNWALCLEAKGDFIGAIKAYQQAIALEHKNCKFHIGLSNAFAKTGDKEKAKQALLEAQKIDPFNEIVKSKLKHF